MTAKIALKCYCQSQDQKIKIEAAAKRAGMSLSQYLISRAVASEPMLGPVTSSAIELIRLDAVTEEIRLLIDRYTGSEDPGLKRDESFLLLSMSREILTYLSDIRATLGVPRS